MIDHHFLLFDLDKLIATMTRLRKKAENNPFVVRFIKG